ncbi:MAG: hypothetical protein EXR69_07115 [Myxococcales bacterium]|nr:hypothetical protein [Myxococcales bacterium]
MITAILITVLGCAGEPADTGPACEVDAGGGHPTWSNFGEAFFITYCDACHAAESPNRFGAPDEMTFDTEDEVRSQTPSIRYTVIDAESMPLGGGLPPEDLTQLDNYLNCLGN